MALLLSRGQLLSPTTMSTESEPNDSLTAADSVALGDTVSATISPAGDVDFYTVSLDSGITLDLDVDANQIGSPLDPVLFLIDRNGMTVLTSSDDVDGLDPQIQYPIRASGRYYVEVLAYSGAGGSGYFYNLKLGFVPPPPPPPPPPTGPGDTTILFAASLGGPRGMAAGPNGELYVADGDGQRLLRVSPTGVVSTLANIPVTDIALDGLGNLLVAGYDSASANVIWRITPTGERTQFAQLTPPGTYGGPAALITIGPDGDVWVMNTIFGDLLRFDPFGAWKDSIRIPIGQAAADLAFSPSGELHFSVFYENKVYKVVDRTAVPVITGAPSLGGLAFDADGYLYVANISIAPESLGFVTLYDPSYHVVKAPFARTNLGGLIHLVFLRDAAGAMTTRLLAANYGHQVPPPFANGLVEMNPTGMRAVGAREGVDLFRIANTQLRDAAVGADYADTLRLTYGSDATWGVSSGALPNGLVLATSGVISGVPSDSGTFAFTAHAQIGAHFGERPFVVHVMWPQVDASVAVDFLLGAQNGLSPDVQRFLDLQGNRNGRFDIGDLRAYLRATSQLPTLEASFRKVAP